MKATLMRIVVTVTIILSIVALMSGCTDAYGHRVVAKGDHERTVRGQDGTVSIAPESVARQNPASPVFDPPNIVPQDIRPGKSRSLEPERLDDPESGDPQAANQPANEEFSGTISSLIAVDNKFAVKIDNGEEQTFTVNGLTKYTVDGKDGTVGDLKVDHMVTVSAEREGETFLAKSVQATSS